MSKLLNDTQLDQLEQTVYGLLERVGMRVDSDEIVAALTKKGCTVGADGRVRFPRESAREFIEHQRSRREVTSSPKPRAPSRPAAVMPIPAFGPGPTRYYDFERKMAIPVTTEIFTQMLKFADATPEIGRVRSWFRQDAPPEIEAIENIVLGLKLTRKITAVDAMRPNQVPYLLELSEIVTGSPGDTTYLGGAQCVTPPLHLGDRSAEELVERARHGARKVYIATMAMIGVTAPVTLAGAVAVASAEVLGGLLAAYAMNPDADHNGTSAMTSLDMASGNAAMDCPETALVDVGVKELFDARLGGHVSAHVRYAPPAKVPGLQAVSENYFASMARARLLDMKAVYLGNGNLDLGGVGSPVQAMLDIEVHKAMSYLDRGLDVNEETVPFEMMCERVLSGGSFIDTDHTAEHFRELWRPELFLRRTPDAEWDGSEAAILDRCHEMAKSNLSRYEPPEWPADVVAALDDVLARAKRDLL